MTRNKFVLSDPHWGHENIVNFTNYDGSDVRPFESMEEMHQTMEDNWNAVVKPNDKVYVLGDVIINKKKVFDENGVCYLDRLNGKKSLIKGNHDIFNKKQFYEKYFESIHGVRVFPHKYVMTHVPVHPSCLDRPAWPVNVHGHLHSNHVMKTISGTEHGGSFTYEERDEKYINVCVENINYTPLALEDLDQQLGY